jgi:hypothetical protein
MPTPNPTLYIMLHKGHNEISLYADAAGTQPANELHVSPGGQINVEFINNNGNNVETGQICFQATGNSGSPFDPAEPVVNQNDNGQGISRNPIAAQAPARIRGDVSPGSTYSFTVAGTWDNGHHHSGHDPIVVIDR